MGLIWASCLQRLPDGLCLELWKPQNIPEKEILRIEIRPAQNVCRVLISRKQNLLILFGAISGNVFHWPEQKNDLFAYLPGLGQ